MNCKSLKRIATLTALAFAGQCMSASTVHIDMRGRGVRPGASGIPQRMVKVLANLPQADTVVLDFAPGRYDFHPAKAPQRELYISNHDQVNPKSLGIILENKKCVVIDGHGADFIFHGTMLPIAAVECSGLTLRNFSIDFENPHIAQLRITASGNDGISFRPEPWVKWRIDNNGRFESYGEGWTRHGSTGIAFENATKHIIYNSGDLWIPLDSIVTLPDGSLRAPRWVNPRITPGSAVALRDYGRPAPGIFLDGCTGTRIENVKVHYAEGMGLLAQLCRDITLDGFGVCLRGSDDPRVFTTQADATHFSGCEGVIDSRHGLYEGMMDDAINVHGTYLKITSHDGRTITGRYMHGQSYGFKWGEPGDSVQIVLSRPMERYGDVNVIETIEAIDAPVGKGVKEFRITLRNPVTLPDSAVAGIENLRWTPRVIFAENVVRNNRARGSLFSTPRRVECTDNLFDHTSGSAILLCGDCNGWYETGACRDVLISRNRFVNNLTCLFQFTEAVISIYPEIPELGSQKECFHGGTGHPGVTIADNEFVTFDAPLVYAKSIHGLNIYGNRVVKSDSYAPFHHNRFNFKFEHVRGVTIERNSMPSDPSISID